MLKHLLLVDDSKTIQKVIKIAFSSTNFTVSSAPSLSEALEVCREKKPGIIIADAHLEDASGPLDYSKLVHESGGVPIILLYGSHETINREAFETAGFQNFMKKPFESKQIVSAVFSFYGENSPDLGENGQKLPPPPMSIPNEIHSHHPSDVPKPNSSKSEMRPPTIPPVSLDGQINEASKGKPAFEEFDPPPAFRPSEIPVPIKKGDEQVSSFQHNAEIPTKPLIVPPVQSIAHSTPFKEAENNPKDHSDLSGISEKTLRALIRSEIEIAFKDQIATIAKSVITAELRRLADQKTRHLSED